MTMKVKPGVVLARPSLSPWRPSSSAVEHGDLTAILSRPRQASYCHRRSTSQSGRARIRTVYAAAEATPARFSVTVGCGDLAAVPGRPAEPSPAGGSSLPSSCTHAHTAVYGGDDGRNRSIGSNPAQLKAYSVFFRVLRFPRAEAYFPEVRHPAQLAAEASYPPRARRIVIRRRAEISAEQRLANFRTPISFNP